MLDIDVVVGVRLAFCDIGDVSCIVGSFVCDMRANVVYTGGC
jgi:hypothetical protein